MKLSKRMGFVSILIIVTSAFLIGSNTHYAGNATKIANPASEFCVENGGLIDIRDDPEGNQYGVCILSNGEEHDEWEYFCSNSNDSRYCVT